MQLCRAADKFNSILMQLGGCSSEEQPTHQLYINGIQVDASAVEQDKPNSILMQSMDAHCRALTNLTAILMESRTETAHVDTDKPNSILLHVYAAAVEQPTNELYINAVYMDSSVALLCKLHAMLRSTGLKQSWTHH